LKKFIPLLNNSSTLRELIAGTLYPDKIWVAETQFNSLVLNVMHNPLKNLSLTMKNETVNKELKEAFIQFTSDFLKEDVEKVMNQFADQVYLFGAGTLGRWIKKEEIKTHLIKEFQEEPYSAVSVDNFVHTNLFFVSNTKNLPKTDDPRKSRKNDSVWWPGIAVDWSVFQESDYFVAAPSMIGMIGDESLGSGIVECYVFRKIGGRWKVVGM